MKIIVKISSLIIILFSLSLGITSCSGNANERNAQTATSALIEGNKNIIAFGHVSIQQVLDKIDYKSLPKINAILGAELTTWKSGINITNPIYYAVQAPLSIDGEPDLIYGLLDVTDKDSLLDKLTGMGYAIEKSGEISFFQENDVTFGVRNKLAILLIKGGKYDGKAAIEKAFLATEGDESEGKAVDILETESDLVTGFDIERLYTTSNTALAKLSQAKQKELKELVADGFIQTTLNFEKGKAIIHSDNLFSEELKDRLFFKTDESASVLKKLGSGEPYFGMSANLDMRKMDEFIADFAPEMNRGLSNTIPGQMGFALAALGSNPMSKLLAGQFGFVATGKPSMTQSEMEFSSFIALGSKDDLIRNLASNYLSLMAKKSGDTYTINELVVELKKDGIYAHSTSSQKGQKLAIPPFAKDFGKKSFSLFVAFNKMDLKSMNLKDGAEVLEIMESLVINVDKNGGEMVLTAKNKKSNILKQVGGFYADKLMGEMAGM